MQLFNISFIKKIIILTVFLFNSNLLNADNSQSIINNTTQNNTTIQSTEISNQPLENNILNNENITKAETESSTNVQNTTQAEEINNNNVQNTTQESNTATDTSNTTSNGNTTIDATRIIKSLTNPLELKKTLDILNNKLTKESEGGIIAQDNNSFFSNVYVFIYEYFIKDFYIFQDTLQSSNTEELFNLLQWFLWIIILISLSLLLESIVNFFVIKKINHNFLQNHNTLKNITLFAYYILKRFLPTVIINIVIIFIFLMLINYNYYKIQIVDILTFFLFLRIIAILINIIFENLTEALFNTITFWSKFLIPVLLFFLTFNYALNQKEFYNLFLLKINLFVFLFMFIFALLRIRSLITKVFFSIKQNKINSIFIDKKRYYALICLLLLFIILISVFIIDYSVTDDIYLKLLLSIICIIVFYALQLYLYSIFHKKVIQQVKSKLFLLQENYIEIKNSLNYFNIEKVWIYFNFIYKYFFLLITLLAVYEISFGNTFTLLSDILSNFVILFIVKLLFLIFIIYTASLVLFMYIINQLIKADSIGDILTIKKLISTYILCYKPYKILVYVIAIIFILGFLGVSITALLASTGIFTFILAFGARDILQNFFNAVLFLLEGSFFINDTVEIAGKAGVVENISLIYVKIRDIDGKLHMIPFSQIDIISNNTKDYSYCVIDIGLEYDANLKVAREILEQIATTVKENPKYQEFILDNLEIIGITALNDFSINLRCKIRTIAGKHNFVKFGFLELIKEEFPKNNLNIPYPIQTIHLQNK